MSSDLMHDPEMDREKLRLLLRHEAFLYATPSQPIRTFHGQAASWLFYSPNITLTHEGATLAARVLLERLKSFEATQIATLGYTAVPLLAACVLLGNGKYSGIFIRDSPKAYGTCGQIEGPVDRTRSV